MPKCWNCKVNLDKELEFCPLCGKKQKDQPVQTEKVELKSDFEAYYTATMQTIKSHQNKEDELDGLLKVLRQVKKSQGDKLSLQESQKLKYLFWLVYHYKRKLKKQKEKGGEKVEKIEKVQKTEQQQQQTQPKTKIVKIKPIKTEIVTATPATVEVSKVFKIADMKDEEQILAELDGYSIKPVYCYQFLVGGVTVNGITWIGARELAKEVGGILTDPRIPPQVVRETDKEIAAGVSYGVMKDGRLQATFWGVGVSNKIKWVYDKRSGKRIPKVDEKAFISATSKAQRNAILACIPKEIQDQVIEKWKNLNSEKVKVITQKETQEIIDETETPEVE